MGWDYVSELLPQTELENDGGIMLTGESLRTRRKTCSSVTLSITSVTWTDPGANPGLRVERPATNRVCHGTGLQTDIDTCYSVSFCDKIS
jgi:hypothetical protein